MELEPPSFTLFARELTPAQRGRLAGLAQRALLQAGIEMSLDETRPHVEVISDERYAALPGIADARLALQDMLTEYCIGALQTEV